MKAKLLEEYYNMPAGTICEIIKDTREKYECDEFYDIETPIGLVGIYKWRVELLPLSPIEDKKSQIQEARKALELLEKELADLTAPKVGNKYETCNSKYILAEINGQYTFICYDGEENGESYSKELHNTIDEAFCKHHSFFTKI